MLREEYRAEKKAGMKSAGTQKGEILERSRKRMDIIQNHHQRAPSVLFEGIFEEEK